ncbi:related to high-affinity nickel transport protein, partial [Phialocephala subalpina]
HLHPVFLASKALLSKVSVYHSRLPGIKTLPLAVICVISLLVTANIVVWIAVAIVLVRFVSDVHACPPKAYHIHVTDLVLNFILAICSRLTGTVYRSLTPTAVLAYSLGLHHALDADHISAIDLIMTRRLIAVGQRPVTVGTFFSLGHSTIVIITSIVVTATAAAVSNRFDGFSQVGGIIGTSVFAAFLILLSVMNIYILYKLVRQIRALFRGEWREDEQGEDPWVGGGCLVGCFKRGFKLIDRPRKMYPLGVLFGLGFDTSSEVALLGISSLQGAQGTSIWLILIFPILFTAGMCLIDTTDGALMMTLYTSTSIARDPITILYYKTPMIKDDLCIFANLVILDSIVLTVITIVAAMVIGVIQLLTLVLNVADPHPPGPFWDGVAAAGDHYDIIGGSICGSFIVFGLLCVLLYGPWRRGVDRRMVARAVVLNADASARHGDGTHYEDDPNESAEDEGDSINCEAELGNVVKSADRKGASAVVHAASQANPNSLLLEVNAIEVEGRAPTNSRD